ncbi:hypothetical protein ACFL2T_02765, partial [Elusimicrobiota bacterium]
MGAEKRYWVRLAGRNKGPLSLEEIVNLPAIGPLTMLCPEGKSPRRRKNWKFARTYAEFRRGFKDARRASPGRVDRASLQEDLPSSMVAPAPPSAGVEPPRRPGLRIERRRTGWLIVALVAAGAEAPHRRTGAPVRP